MDDGRCKELSENAQISCFVNRPYDIIPIKDVSVLKRKMVSAGGSKSNRNPCAARISARAASTAVLERLLHTQEVDGPSLPVYTKNGQVSLKLVGFYLWVDCKMKLDT